MNEQLNKIEQEVIEEFKQNLGPEDQVSELLLQMATVSAKVTKSFLEKYETETKTQ